MTLVNAGTVSVETFVASHDGPFVYAFRATGTPYVKVGFSHDPVKRLAQVQTLAPQPLELIGLMPGTAADEATAHRHLAPWRHRGEWFDVDTATKDFAPHLGAHLSPWMLVRFLLGYGLPRESAA